MAPEATVQLAGVAEVILGGILKEFGGFLSHIYPVITHSFSHLMKAFVGCYIAWTAYKMLKGGVEAFSHEGKNLLFTCLYLSFALGVIETDFYLDKVAFWFVDFTMQVASFVASGGKGTSLMDLLQSIDTAAGQIITTIKAKMPTGSLFSSAAVYLEALICLPALAFVFVAMYAGFLALLVMGFGSIFVYATLGGIAIFLAPFEPVRWFFKSWVRGIFQNALMVIFASLIMSCCVDGLTNAVEVWAEEGINPTQFFTAKFFICLCWPVITLAMLLKSPDFASSLSGSMSGSTSGIAGGISLAGGWFGSRMTSAFNPVRQYQNMKAASAGASKGYDAGSRAFSRLRGIIK